MSTSPSPAVKSWQAAFDAQSSVDDGKRSAFSNFLARGLPTAKNDAWKYTDLRRLTLKEFKTPASTSAIATDVEGKLLSMQSSLRLVYVNGLLDVALSSAAPAGVSVSHPNLRVVRGEVFELLNAALATTPIRLEVGASQCAPIYLVFVWTDTSKSLMAHPRMDVIVDANVKVTLVEHHVGAAGESNLTNSVIGIEVGENALLEHIRLQEDALGNFNIGSIRAAVSKSGSYVNHQHVLGGGLARADIYVELKGQEARTELHGLVFASQTQHLDVRTCIDHQVPNTKSREDYRGIADHRGRVVFNGKVIVAKDAQRTDAAQSSRNLLLSDQAEIDTRPELEIYANDVKCAHGATVGQLDANSLFYLQSRGVDQSEARSLLTQAFATEVIERLTVQAVRDRVLAQLKARMKIEESVIL